MKTLKLLDQTMETHSFARKEHLSAAKKGQCEVLQPMKQGVESYSVSSRLGTKLFIGFYGMLILLKGRPFESQPD